MTYTRRLKGGIVKTSKLPKSPNGRTLCRQCSGEVRPPRKSFCNDACVHQWKLRTDPNYVRALIFERDRGVCAGCFSDTEAARMTWQTQMLLYKPGDPNYQRLLNLVRSIPPSRRFHTWWDLDHIEPVSKGGGECTLDEYQTLCISCHAKKTQAMNDKDWEEGEDNNVW